MRNVGVEEGEESFSQIFVWARVKEEVYDMEWYKNKWLGLDKKIDG